MVIVAPGTSEMQRTGNGKRHPRPVMREEARMDQCFMRVETYTPSANAKDAGLDWRPVLFL